MTKDTCLGDLWLVDGFGKPVYFVMRADPRVRVAKETLEGWFDGATVQVGDFMKFEVDGSYLVYRVNGYDEESREYLLAWPD